MLITDLISITELSRLTKKSRPTIYKYINEYNNGNYDEIPYSMINLFKMAETATKSEIISYCNATYGTTYATNCDKELQDLINLSNELVINDLFADTWTGGCSESCEIFDLE